MRAQYVTILTGTIILALLSPIGLTFVAAEPELLDAWDAIDAGRMAQLEKTASTQAESLYSGWEAVDQGRAVERARWQATGYTPPAQEGLWNGWDALTWGATVIPWPPQPAWQSPQPRAVVGAAFAPPDGVIWTIPARANPAWGYPVAYVPDRYQNRYQMTGYQPAAAPPRFDTDVAAVTATEERKKEKPVQVAAVLAPALKPQATPTPAQPMPTPTTAQVDAAQAGTVKRADEQRLAELRLAELAAQTQHAKTEMFMWVGISLCCVVISCFAIRGLFKKGV